jgi:hypothetical protein
MSLRQRLQQRPRQAPCCDRIFLLCTAIMPTLYIQPCDGYQPPLASLSCFAGRSAASCSKRIGLDTRLLVSLLLMVIGQGVGCQSSDVPLSRPLQQICFQSCNLQQMQLLLFCIVASDPGKVCDKARLSLSLGSKCRCLCSRFIPYIRFVQPRDASNPSFVVPRASPPRLFVSFPNSDPQNPRPTPHAPSPPPQQPWRR